MIFSFWSISYLDLSSLHFSLQPLCFFPPFCHIFLVISHPFCCLPGFIRQQWGRKLHFSCNISCCKAPAGVIFFLFFFFFLQRWKHQAAFAAHHVCKSEQWCTLSEASSMMCLDCLDTMLAPVWDQCVCVCVCIWVFLPFSDSLNVICACSTGMVGWYFKVSTC